MAKRYGRSAVTAYNPENDWGTPNAGGTFIRLINADPLRQKNKTAPNIITTGTAPVAEALICEGEEAGNQFVHPLSFEGLEVPLKHFFGVASDVDTAGGNKEWTFDLQLSEGEGLTVDHYKGMERTSPINYIHEVFQGLLINQATFNWQNSGVPTVTFDTIAQTAADRATTTTVPGPIHTTQMATLIDRCTSMTIAFNGRTLKLDSASLGINRQLERNNKIGDMLTDRPVPGGDGAVQVTLSADFDYTEDDTYSDHLNEVEGDVVITITGGEIAATGENYLMRVTLHNAEITSYNDSTPGNGVLKASATWTAKGDASSNESGCVFFLRNTTAAVA